MPSLNPSIVRNSPVLDDADHLKVHQNLRGNVHVTSTYRK